jgi:tetratricopeptide (TPR) repeat protein
LALARELGDRRLEAVAAANLGSICAALGDADGARRQLEPALAAFVELELPEWQAFALHELSRVHENLGDLDAAAEGFRAALALRRAAERQAEVAETLLALTRVASSRGADSDARWCAEEAYALAQEFDAPGEQMVAGAHLAALGALEARTAIELMGRNRRLASFAHKLETSYLLWRSSGEFDHLEEAQRLLESFRSKAREAGSDALVTGVAVHRAVAADWARHGGAV